MQVVRHPCACALAKVQTDVKALSLRHGAQKRLRARDQIPQLDNLILTERRDPPFCDTAPPSNGRPHTDTGSSSGTRSFAV